MPDNKSHHYVPRFYLKNFSRSGKNIDLFNIDRGQLIRNAPIKGQCCRDYFYGKSPEQEKSLSSVEGEVATLFKIIMDQVRLPHPFTAGHLLLCFHIATQANRTQYAADSVNELVDGMWREILKHDPKVTPDMLQQVRFGYDNPGLISLGYAALGFPLLMDLECRVLLSPRGSEFITSDNPIVMYNQFMHWRTEGSHTALASKGLQVFFPMWPFLTLVMYDRDVYHFGGAKSALVHMASPRDVHELNMLQFISATKNVYTFSPAANIFKVAQDAIRLRRKKKVEVKAFPQPDESGRKSEIIATSHQDIRTNAMLSFMRVHKNAKSWLRKFQAQRYQQVAVVRDEALMERFEKYTEAVKKGEAVQEDAIKCIFGRSVLDGTF